MLNRLSQKITRRRVQIALGVLWLLDGFLQLQRQMFTGNFASQIIAPAGAGQPGFVSSPIHFAVRTVLVYPALFDMCFALIQLGLGVLILWRRTAKYGLVTSVIWGLAVWYVGEGLGGIAGGQALLLTGAPGAALLYAVIALGVMPPAARNAEGNERPAWWLVYAWTALWMGGELLLVWSKASTKSLAAMITGMASGAPGWLAALDIHAGNWLGARGNWLLVVAGLVYLAVGFLVLLPRRYRTLAVSAGIIIALVFWIVGQSLGSYYSGLATDPNTAPLIILLGIAILGAKEITLDIS